MFTIYAELSGIPGLQSKEVQTLEQFVAELKTTPSLETVFNVAGPGSDTIHDLEHIPEILGMWSYDDVDMSGPVYTWIASGFRLLSLRGPNGSGIKSLFTYTETDDRLLTNTVRRQDRNIRFAASNGTVDLFRKKIREHRHTLISYTDVASQLVPFEDDVTPNIRYTLDQYMKMSCVFVGLELYLCESPLLNKIRNLMEIDSKTIFGRTSLFNLPGPIRRYIPRMHVKPILRRPNGLVPFVIKQMRAKNIDSSEVMTVSSALTMDQLAHVMYVLELDAHVIREDVYYKLASILKKTNVKSKDFKKKSISHTDFIKGVLDNKCPSIYASIRGSPRRVDVSRKNPVSGAAVLRVSGELSMNAHIEFEFNVNTAGKFDENIIHSGFYNAFSVLKRGENGGMKESCGDWNGSTGAMASNKLCSGTPYYVTDRPRDVDPGNDIVVSKEINTIDDLNLLFKDIINCIEEDDPKSILFGTEVYYISPDAFDKEEDVLDGALFNGLEGGSNKGHYILSLRDFLDQILLFDTKNNISIDRSGVVLGVYDTVRRAHNGVVRDEAEISHSIETTKSEEGDVKGAMEDAELIRNAKRREFNVRQTNSIESFIISNKDGKSSKFVNMTPKNDIIQRVMYNVHSGGGTQFPIIQKIAEAGYKIIEEDINSLENARITGCTEEVIASCQRRVDNGANPQVWVTHHASMYDPLLDGMLLDTYYIDPTKRRSNYCKPQTGERIMDRVRTIDAPDVEIGKRYNPTEWEVSLPPVSQDAREYKGGDLVLFDQKSQYMSVGMGCGNNTRPNDPWNMWPQFMTERNPSLQEITRPIMSYFIDCGTINIDPTTVDMEALRDFTTIHWKHGSRLKALLTGRHGSMVISSVDLITWTMDIIQEQQLDEGGDVDMYDIAREFQIDILKIKTGRFSFDMDTRDCLWHILYKGEIVPFEDFGIEFVEDPQLDYKISTALRHRLVVPTEHPLLVEYKHTADMVGMNPLLFIDIPVPVRNGLLCTAVRESCAVFGLLAKNLIRIKSLQGEYLPDGYQVTRADVKLATNKSIGKCRMNGMNGWVVKNKMDLLETEKYTRDKAYISTDRFNPNMHVYVTEFPLSRKTVVQAASVMHRDVRMAPEGLRNYIVSQSGRIMEKISIALPVNDPCFRIRTDSLLVSNANACMVEAMFSEYTQHSIQEDGVGIPGSVPGYTKEVVSREMIQTEFKYKSVKLKDVSHEYRGGMYEGLATAQRGPSDIKKRCDQVEYTVVKNSQLMYDFHKEQGGILDDVIGPDLPPDVFCSEVANKCMGKDANSIVVAFQKDFDLYEAMYIKAHGNMRIAGGPGTGKTHTVLRLVSTYDELKDGLSISATPYHAITQTFKPYMSHAATAHSFMGCGVRMSDTCRKPFRLLTRAGDNAWRPFKPYNKKNAITIFDETQSISKSFEEGLKASDYLGGTMIISGDEYQLSCIGGDGVDLNGSVVRSITNNFTYIKDIEYRKKEPKYIIGKQATRDGDAMMYIDPSMCDYTSGGAAYKNWIQKLEIIAHDIFLDGKSDTIIACQSYNTAGICVSTVVRLVLLMGKNPEHVLIHIGGASEDKNNTVDDEIQEAELQRKYLYRPGKLESHKQKLHGVPLMFYKNIHYIVTKGFSCHSSNVGVDNGKVNQTTMLRYVDSRIRSSVMKCKKKPTLYQDVLHLTFREVTSNPNGGRLIELTEYEAATYLMYPFVAQRVGLIGLTLTNVTSLQISMMNQYGPGNVYTRSYEPLREQLRAVAVKYGRWSTLTTLCRQLQVILTRVTTNSRTNIVDVEITDMFYKHMNYKAMSGADCDGFCALFNTRNRKDPDAISKINRGLSDSIVRRVYSTVDIHPTDRILPAPRTLGLVFPASSLVYSMGESREFMNTLVSNSVPPSIPLKRSHSIVDTSSHNPKLIRVS